MITAGQCNGLSNQATTDRRSPCATPYAYGSTDHSPFFAASAVFAGRGVDRS